MIKLSSVGYATWLLHYFPGPLPTSISCLVSLKELHAGFNDFTGIVCEGVLLNMTTLNSSGTLPHELAALKVLEILDLGRNQLEGISSIDRSRRKSSCCLAGPVPVGILRMKAQGTRIWVNNNMALRLPDNIHEIGDHIQELDFSYMGLVGTI
jgi:hypothetical protein